MDLELHSPPKTQVHIDFDWLLLDIDQSILPLSLTEAKRIPEGKSPNNRFETNLV